VSPFRWEGVIRYYVHLADVLLPALAAQKLRSVSAHCHLSETIEQYLIYLQSSCYIYNIHNLSATYRRDKYKNLPALVR